MHKYHYCGYTISEFPYPPPHESIQYVMDLKTAGPPKVVEEQK